MIFLRGTTESIISDLITYTGCKISSIFRVTVNDHTNVILATHQSKSISVFR